MSMILEFSEYHFLFFFFLFFLLFFRFSCGFGFPIISIVANLQWSLTGLFAHLPFLLFGFKFLQDIMLPLMVKNGRVSRAGNENMLSPIDYVPAECAAWRFSMLNDSTGLSDTEIQSIRVPTLLVQILGKSLNFFVYLVYGTGLQIQRNLWKGRRGSESKIICDKSD